MSCNSTYAISEMFSTKLKFVADYLLALASFNKKFKNNNLELSNNKKVKYEIKNPVDWESDTCCICSFPLQINLNNMTDTRNTKKFSYCDFYIMQEHKFLRHILIEEELAKTKNVKNADICFISFVKFLKIVVNLKHTLNNYDMIKN